MASTATHSSEKLSIFGLAATFLVGAVGAAFGVGWLIGRILL